MTREAERVDSAYRSTMSVQSSLVMHPIHAFGNEQATSDSTFPSWPRANGSAASGLTEPDHGSDPASMKTRSKAVEGGFVLNGAKMCDQQFPACRCHDRLGA